jgi:uncharacterized alpha-E superfamily protein
MLSRVADSLYWMGRYLERAEHTARLVAVKLESMVEQTKEDADASWARVVAAVSGEEFAPGTSDPAAIAHSLILDRTNSSSLVASLRFARDNARQVREQLSNEVWENLNRLYLRLQSEALDDGLMPSGPLPREVLDSLYALGGVSYSTLRHGEGWHFLELGRHIERAQLVSRLLDIHFGAPVPGYAPLPPPKYFDWLVLLKSCTAFEPYCKEFTAALRADRIAQFLLFDAEFPHSVRFSVDRVRQALTHVAPGAPAARRAACERLAGRLKAAIDYGQIDDLDGSAFDRFLGDITVQCEQVHDAVYAAYIAYDAGAVL